MPGIVRRTVLKTELSQVAVELSEEGYDRFSFQPFDKNRKFVELRAWRFKARKRTNTEEVD